MSLSVWIDNIFRKCFWTGKINIGLTMFCTCWSLIGLTIPQKFSTSQGRMTIRSRELIENAVWNFMFSKKKSASKNQKQTTPPPHPPNLAKAKTNYIKCPLRMCIIIQHIHINSHRGDLFYPIVLYSWFARMRYSSYFYGNRSIKLYPC